MSLSILDRCFLWRNGVPVTQGQPGETESLAEWIGLKSSGSGSGATAGSAGGRR